MKFVLDSCRVKFEMFKPNGSAKISVPKNSKILNMEIFFSSVHELYCVDVHYAAPYEETTIEQLEICTYDSNTIVENLHQLRFYKYRDGVFVFLKVVPDSN